MYTLTVSAKGQITLRQDVLRHLGLAPGDRIAVHKLPNGRIEVTAVQPAGSVADVFGLLHRDGAPALSVDDINALSREGWAATR